MLLRRLKEQVCEVGVGGVLFHLVGDGVLQAFGLLHHVIPFLIASAVREDGETATAQAFQLLDVEPTAATGGQPKHLRVTGGHDECCLLALNETDVCFGVLWQKVLSEEALMKDKTIGQLPLHLSFQNLIMNPTVVTLPVSAGVVGHNMTSAHALLLVDLPEDYIAVLGYTYLIILIDALHGCRVEAELAGTAAAIPRPENTLRRMVIFNQSHR